MRPLPLILCLALAACGGGGSHWNNPFRKADRGLQLQTDVNGLAIMGRHGERIDFGRAPEGVIAVLDRELAPGRQMSLEDCPAGISQQVSYGDLVLTFTDEQFVGWRGVQGAAGQVCGRVA